VIALAPPVMVFVATNACFMSIKIVEFAAIAVVVLTEVPAKPNVKVAAVAAVLVTIMLLTTVVVDAGVVYKTVAVLVVAAPRNNGFATVAIC
jgi:hypothetical protein